MRSEQPTVARPEFLLGGAVPLAAATEIATPLYTPASHLVTHGVVVGMTGSGKTGLVTVMIEEALRARVPVFQPRWAMSFMRGPMTRGEIRRAREGGE